MKAMGDRLVVVRHDLLNHLTQQVGWMLVKLTLEEVVVAEAGLALTSLSPSGQSEGRRPY